MAKIVFMYSGQGSHYYQMGKKLYEAEPVYKEWIDKLDNIAKKLTGVSIAGEIFNPSRTLGDAFKRTLYTHPAIFMTEYALTQVLLSKGLEPDLVFGASLGEYTAAAVSGIFDYQDALEIVIKQAVILEKCPDGGMLAIVENPSLYDEMKLLSDNTIIAGINFDNHFVVTGKTAALENIVRKLKEEKKTCQLLPVSQGFHSALIDSARDEYLAYLQSKSFKKSRIPLLSCCTAKSEEVLTYSHFWDAVREPILFREAAEALNDEQYKCIDVGPSGTLAAFLGYLNPSKRQDTFVIMNQFGQEIKNLEKLFSSI